jgi:hypothetical protein
MAQEHGTFKEFDKDSSLDEPSVVKVAFRRPLCRKFSQIVTIA